MCGTKCILSIKGLKTSSKSPKIANSAFANLLKFVKITYLLSPGSKIDFVWLIARQSFIWHFNAFEVEKNYKQYLQKCFLRWSFVLLVC